MITDEKDIEQRGEPAPGRRSATAKKSTDIAERLGLLFLFAVMIAIFAIAQPGTFATAANARSIGVTESVIAVLALALLPPLIANRFDVSVGANMTISAIACAAVIGYHGWALVPAIGIAVAMGTFIGTLNGVMVAYFGVNSIIGTLGVSTIIGGLVTAYTKGVPVSQNLPPALTNLSTETILGIPDLFLIMVVIAIVVWFVLTQTPFGRYLEAVGANMSAARLTGLPVARIVFLSFVMAGVISGVAGVLLIATEASASPDTADITTIVPALAAAFLGWTTWRPGRYNVVGTVIALFFLGTLTSGLALIGAQSWVTDAVNGAVVIVAVAVGVQVKRRRTGTVEVGE
jgi:ribose transport system permease protein